MLRRTLNKTLCTIASVVNVFCSNPPYDEISKKKKHLLNASYATWAVVMIILAVYYTMLDARNPITTIYADPNGLQTLPNFTVCVVISGTMDRPELVDYGYDLEFTSPR
jgi:hypothetical protein